MNDVKGRLLQKDMMVYWRRDETKNFPHSNLGIVTSDTEDKDECIKIRVVKAKGDTEIGTTIRKFGHNLKIITSLKDLFLYKLEC
jgi:hypothetical protein